MRNLLILALATFLALGATACSEESQATPSTSDKPATVRHDAEAELPAGHPPVDSTASDAAAAGCPAMGVGAPKADADACPACPSGAAATVAEKADCCGTCGGTRSDETPAAETADGCGDGCDPEKKPCGDDCKGDGSCDACQAKKKVEN